MVYLSFLQNPSGFYIKDRGTPLTFPRCSFESRNKVESPICVETIASSGTGGNREAKSISLKLKDALYDAELV